FLPLVSNVAPVLADPISIPAPDVFVQSHAKVQVTEFPVRKSNSGMPVRPLLSRVPPLAPNSSIPLDEEVTARPLFNVTSPLVCTAPFQAIAGLLATVLKSMLLQLRPASIVIVWFAALIELASQTHRCVGSAGTVAPEEPPEVEAQCDVLEPLPPLPT